MNGTFHLVVGAGVIGSAVARRLADAGTQVRVVTRSGSGPDHPLVEKVAADAADAVRLASLADGAAVIYNCANPPYTRWSTDWPPLAASLLAAAESSGAVLVTCSNLYGYGPVDHPLTEKDPQAATYPKGRVRAQMWEDALAANRAGRVRGLAVNTEPLRKSRDFRLLWTGEMISQVGSQITLVALLIQMYALTHSAAAVGLIGLVQLVPLMAASLFGGSWIDRFDRK
jgi:NAD(P)-dependent dehydrogenase (short-subunit alcohol dehydrogenase family)